MPDNHEPERTVDAPARDAQASVASDREETATATPRAGFEASAFGPPAAPDEVGALGPYRIVKQLGAGGMGAVYLAIDTRLDRKLALKVMLPEFAANKDAKERFIREAKAVAKIGHDNVVTIYEADERDGVPYIAMQFLQGAPLDDFLKKKGAPPLAHCVRIGIEAARGLAAAHELGLVHRDIKPANLWLEAPNGRVKVLDFGLAKPVGTDAELTKSGAVVGTPAYMSPEQARGSKVDARTDIFSLGTVMYRLLTGKNPFVGENIMAVLMALGMEEPTPIRELNPNVPAALASFVMRMMAKKPEARPQTALEVAQGLRAALSQPSASADVSTSMPVVVQPLPQPVVPMHVTAAPESAFANLEDDADDANDGEATAAESLPAAPQPDRKKGGKGLLLAVGGALLLAAIAIAVIISQTGKKGEPTAEQKPPEPKPVVPATPKDGGKPPAGSIPVLKPVGNEWVDVLALDEKLADGYLNFPAWTKRNGKWTSQGGDETYSAMALPLFATGSYKLTAEVSRDAGGDYIGIVLPVGFDRAVSFGYHGFSGTVGGFLLLAGRDANDPQNPTRTPQTPVPLGRIVKLDLAVSVTADRVQLRASVDGGAPIEWAGTAADVAPGPNQPFVPRRIYLGTYKTQWTVHSLKFQKIDGDAAVIEWGPPGSDPDRKAAEWVLSVGGRVRVNGEERDIAAVGDLPKSWFALTRVDLGSKQISDADLSVLKELKALRSLDLGSTPTTDAWLVHLKQLKSLTWLNLGNTRVTGTGLVHLKELPHLTWLHLGESGATGEGLEHLPALTTLTLYGAPVTDAGLERLAKGSKNLQSLNLHNTQVTDAGLAHLKKLKELQELSFVFTKVTDAGLARLKELKNLTRLNLGGMQVTDAGLTHLKELKSLWGLDLVNTAVTDAGLAHLKDCKALTLLDLRGSKVTAKGVEEFATALPVCRIIHNAVDPKYAAAERRAAEWVLSLPAWVCLNGTNDPVQALHSLPKEGFVLTGAVMGENPNVTDANLEQLKDCKALTHLWLNGTKVTDAGLALFADRKRLALLHLSNTSVTDKGLAPFKDCKGLTELWVEKTKVTPALIAEFAKALPQCKIVHDGGVIEPYAADRKAAEWVLTLGGTVRVVPGAEKLTVAIKDLPAGPLFLAGVDLSKQGGVVSDDELRRLSSARKMEGLYLPSAKVTDAGVAHLKELTELRVLWLQGTGVTDVGLEHLTAMTKLHELNLTRTKVTADGIAKLAKAIPQCKIEYDGGVIEPKK